MKHSFRGQFKEGLIWEMIQIKVFTYIPDLALSNKHLKVIIRFLEFEILNEKVEVLLNKNQIKPQLSQKIS